MRSYSTSGINSLMIATSDINLSHIAMKLWLMLSASNSQSIPGGAGLVWNELWFAYEGFLDVLDTEAQVGLYPVSFIGCVLSFSLIAIDFDITRYCVRGRPNPVHQYPQVRIDIGQTYPYGNSSANEIA